MLLVVPLTGTDPLARKSIEFSRGEFNETTGRFSADGKFIAYRSDEDNALKGEVYVRPFDAATGLAGDGKWRVSKDGVNAMIHWRSDGKEIFTAAWNWKPMIWWWCRRMCPLRRHSRRLHRRCSSGCRGR